MDDWLKISSPNFNEFLRQTLLSRPDRGFRVGFSWAPYRLRGDFDVFDQDTLWA